MDCCTSCKACWSKNEFTEGCKECGGFAMTRYCPTCNGKCGSIWRRQVNMSNAYKEAFYKGGCKLKMSTD